MKEINLISQQCFWINRVIDRAVSVLESDFSLTVAPKLLHGGFAHKYPILADSVNEILPMFGEKIDYLETPADVSEYEDIVAVFQSILDENIKLYQLLKNAIVLSRQEYDINTETHLLLFTNEFNKYMAQCITLRDKADLMKDNLAMFDLSIPQFFTLE
jgi:hypothetical protein